MQGIISGLLCIYTWKTFVLNKVLGTKGLIQTRNMKTSELCTITQNSCQSEALLGTFFDRYKESFPTELNHFVDAIEGKFL